MKPKLLYVLLVLLVLANAVLIFMLLDKPHLRPKSPDSFLMHELSLSDEQLNKFEELRFSHREEMRVVLDGIKPLKDQLFHFNNSSVNKDSIANLIGNLEAKKEIITYTYFNDLRGICNGSQKRKFDKTIQKVMRRASRKHPPKRNN
jgi:hypothetical protein